MHMNRCTCTWGKCGIRSGVGRGTRKRLIRIRSRAASGRGGLPDRELTIDIGGHGGRSNHCNCNVMIVITDHRYLQLRDVDGIGIGLSGVGVHVGVH